MAVLGKAAQVDVVNKRGAGFRNIMRGVLDTATAPLGALGIDIDPNYEGKNADKWNQFSQIGDSIGAAAGGIGMSIATGGLSKALTSTEVLKYGGTVYGKRGKRYFALGGVKDNNPQVPINNPVPNAYTVVKSKVPYIKNGENTGRLIDHYDTLTFQDYGYWGKNLEGVNVPPPLPLDANGKVDFTAIKKMGIKPSTPPPPDHSPIYPINQSVKPFAQYKEGGLLTEYQGNTHEFGGIPISQTDEVEDKENSFDMKDGNKYIFSNSIFMDNKKKTYAQGARVIANKYKLRDGDAMAKVAQQRELEKLSQKQEFTKEMLKTPEEKLQEQIAQQSQQFDNGGYLNTLYMGGGRIQHGGKKSSVVFPQQKIEVPANDYWTPELTFGELNGVSAMPKLSSKPITQFNKLDVVETLQRGNTQKYRNSLNKPKPKEYNSNPVIPAIGYGAQALSNLPSLFTKPAKVNFQRVNPEMVDLSAQRDEARRARNLQYAMTQKQAGQMDNAGQAGAYSNTALSSITGAYGDAFNQSLMTQNSTNAGYKNQANAQNAQIQMQEQIARQQEADAVRSAKLQAINNIGQIAATAGNTYQQMDTQDAYINNMNKIFPDYGLLDANGNFNINRKKQGYKYGGKIRRIK